MASASGADPDDDEEPVEEPVEELDEEEDAAGEELDPADAEEADEAEDVEDADDAEDEDEAAGKDFLSMAVDSFSSVLSQRNGNDLRLDHTR